MTDKVKTREEEMLFPTKFNPIDNIPPGTLDESARTCRDIIANAYHAMLQGDQGALGKILHPDIVFREAAGLPYGVEAKGIEGTLQGVAGMFEYWSSVDVDLIEVCGGKDMAIAYMYLRNVARATGKPYEGFVCEVFRFKDGKVIEWHPVYWDTHAAREACGL